MWFRNIARGDIGGKPVDAPAWYDHDFIPVVSKAVEQASEKISELGFCEKRIWEVVRLCHDGEVELVPLMSALQDLPQLRHRGHESCTSIFCEYDTLNFTSVTQLHKCYGPQKCEPTTDEMFNQSLLVAALQGHTMTTAWTLDGMSLVAQDRSYIAVSHVWSDGTGAGAWKAGQVNRCLWDYFVHIAEMVQCDGVWWDTVCIPQEKAVRSIALNNMHHNYAAAKYTVVHDLYLAGIEWRNDGSPCIALVLSPWFTRGWTALELFFSKRVFVFFRQGDGFIVKDLDREVLAQHRFLDSHAHWIATDIVKRLRHAGRTFNSAGGILSVLQARYTSWSRDQSIISGFMCGLSDHVTLSEEDITKQVLRKVGYISQNCLLHGLPTMPEPEWSWCPPRFFDIPSGSDRQSYDLCVNADGTLAGFWEIWYIPSKTYVHRGMIWPLSMNMRIKTQVRSALQEPEKCVILTCDTYDSQGLLVRLKAYNDRQQDDVLYCKYIGAVNVSYREIRKPRFHIWRRVVIGYKPGMVDVGVVDWEENDSQYKKDKKLSKEEVYDSRYRPSFR